MKSQENSPLSWAASGALLMFGVSLVIGKLGDAVPPIIQAINGVTTEEDQSYNEHNSKSHHQQAIHREVLSQSESADPEALGEENNKPVR